MSDPVRMRPSASRDARDAPRSALTRAVAAHLDSRDVSRIIYGATIGLALVVALQEHPPASGNIVALLVGTAVAVGLAEAYSEFVGTEARARRQLRAEEVHGLLKESAAVMLGVGFPAVFFALAALDAISTERAFSLAKWTGLGLICTYGFLAARLAGSRSSRALLHALAVGAIGGLLIGLKAVLH
jgi:hypothetical protein